MKETKNRIKCFNKIKKYIRKIVTVVQSGIIWLDRSVFTFSSLLSAKSTLLEENYSYERRVMCKIWNNCNFSKGESK